MRDDDRQREDSDEYAEDDMLLGDDFDSALTVNVDGTSQEPYILPLTQDEALGCQFSGVTTLSNGQPVTIRVLPNIIVDTDPPQAIVDGVRHELGEQSAILLKAVVEAKGEWISSKQIERAYSVFDAQHADRAKRNLPERLRLLIESSTGKGHRLRI